MSASSTLTFLKALAIYYFWHHHNGEKSETEKMMREVNQGIGPYLLGSG